MRLGSNWGENMTPGELKAWRKANGYTQEALAKALKISRETVSKWEAGTTEMQYFLDLALESLEKKKQYLTVSIKRSV